MPDRQRIVPAAPSAAGQPMVACRLSHTARISGRVDKPDSPTHQDTYLKALASRPKVTIHYGKFLKSTVRMPLAAPQPGGPRTVEVIKTEEKGSDVNLATYLLIDAFRKDSDAAVLISNDSDLCEPIRIVQDEFKVPVGLLIPHSRRSQALRRLKPAFVKQIRSGPLSASQFPGQGAPPEAGGGVITSFNGQGLAVNSGGEGRQHSAVVRRPR